MKKVNCRFCNNPTDLGERCSYCACITTSSIPEDISANSKFTEYSYNNYSSRILEFIFQSWNKTQSYLLFNNNIFSRIGRAVLSPITILNPTVEVANTGKLIDIGCGRGDFLKYLPKEIDYLGVDIVNYGLKDPKILILNFETDPIDYKFNFARSIHSVEHAQDPKNFLTRISNIVEKEGLVVIATPNSKFWLKDYFKNNWITLNVKTHYCILSPEALEKELKILDFQIINSSTYSLFSHIDSLAKKFRFKHNLFTFFIFASILYPVAVFEKLFGVADSIIIYAKKN